MKRNKPIITIENNIVFLTLDLKGLGLYDRGRAIRQFVNNDIKILEDYVDEIIKGIFLKNDIFVNSLDKSVLERAFDTLKAKGKNIELNDFYGGGNKIFSCKYIDTKDNITILLEDDRYLISGVEIKEINL